ncbi:MAG TPA: MOSC domain-containing protein [Actinomycetota bacterium]|jgi:MOSC domain-containing protein YiiM
MTGGTILSVNVSRARDILRRGKPDRTGIFKTPVEGRVGLRRHQLDGDEQADRRVHGGPEMAAYAYAREDTDWWEDQLGKPLGHGTFGENLTLLGVDIGAARVGERWRAGNTVVEVTKPRSPCWKLALRMEDPTFPRKFRSAQRTGTYLAVVEEGDLAAGDPVETVWRPGHPLTIGILAYLYEHDLKLAALAREAAAMPLHPSDWLELLRGAGIPEEHWIHWADEKSRS